MIAIHTPITFRILLQKKIEIAGICAHHVWALENLLKNVEEVNVVNKISTLLRCILEIFEWILDWENS